LASVGALCFADAFFFGVDCAIDSTTVAVRKRTAPAETRIPL